MKKLLLSLTACLLFSASGWADVWEASVPKFEAVGDITLTSSANVEKKWNLAVDWKSAKYFNSDATKGSQIGSGSNPANSVTLSSSDFADASEITSIKVNTSGASKINATLKVTVGGKAFTIGNTTSDSYSLTANASDVTFNGKGSGEIKLVYTNNSAKAIYIKSISVTYSSVADTRTPVTLTFPETDYLVNLGEEFTEPVLTVDPAAAASEVRYAIEPAGKISINETTGVLGTLVEGKYTVTASIKDSKNYQDQEVSYTLKVKDPNKVEPDGTLVAPYSVEDVLAMETFPSEKCWVRGYLVGSMVNNNLELGTANAAETNIVLAANADIANSKDGYIPVALPSGTIRSALNLKANKTLLGKEIMVYGSLETYFQMNGVKNVSDYKLEIPTAPAAPTILVNGEAAAGETVAVQDGKISFGEVAEGVAIYYSVKHTATEAPDQGAADEPNEGGITIEQAPARVNEESVVKDGVTYTLYSAPVKLEDGSSVISYFARANGLDSEVKTLTVTSSTGIEGVAVEEGAAVWYDLNGVRVAEPKKGLYIRVQGGKATKEVR